MIPLSSRLSGRKQKELFAMIRRQPAVSKQELQEQSGLTGSTLTRMLDELVSLGAIAEAGLGESTGGRRPILYRIRPDFGYAFGFEISRTASVLTLFDLELGCLETQVWRMTERMTPDLLLTEAVAAAEGMLSKRRLVRAQVVGIGIGAVGPLNRSEGLILSPIRFSAPGWSHVEIVRRLQDALDVPVHLDNGANAAVLGESWAARGRAHRHMLYVHLGVGLRSAFLSDGKIVYGAADTEDAIGQMIIQTDGIRLEGTGNYGALEAYSSIPAIEQEARSRLKLGRESLLAALAGEPELVRFPHIVEAIAKHDPLAEEIIRQSAAYFGIGLANLLNMLHPAYVILGGPLVGASELFFDTATGVALGKLRRDPFYEVEFSRGLLGENALVTGAAAMAIDKMTE